MNRSSATNTTPQRSPYRWSRWRAFPDPRKGGVLHAPIGPGLYELSRRGGNRRLVLVGIGGHCAKRMTSILPAPLGTGGRRNDRKCEYVRRHLTDIEYRTRPCATRAEAQAIETEMLRKNRYVFGT